METPETRGKTLYRPASRAPPPPSTNLRSNPADTMLATAARRALGLVTYAFFFWALCNAFAWISNVGAWAPAVSIALPHCLDAVGCEVLGAEATLADVELTSLAFNALILAAWAVPHSTMARPEVKKLMRCAGLGLCRGGEVARPPRRWAARP